MPKVVITGPAERFTTKPPEPPPICPGECRPVTTQAYSGKSDEDVEEVTVALNGIVVSVPALEEVEVDRGVVEVLQNAGFDVEEIDEWEDD